MRNARTWAISAAWMFAFAQLGATQAQAGYGYYGYPYGYEQYGYQYDAYGNVIGYYDPNLYDPNYYNPSNSSMSFGTLPTYEQLMQQSQANMAAIEAQMAQLEQQINANVAQMEQSFIKYYRDQTGDLQTPDQQALVLGQNLWCTNNPVECRQSNQQAAAWSQQSAAAHQQRMAQNQASFDAYQQTVADRSATQDANFNSWMANQNAMYEANQGFIQGVIYEEGNYTNPNTGQTMSLPFAPSNNWAYQSPAGNPLWFDQSSNVWYEVDPAGNYTPYYGQ